MLLLRHVIGSNLRAHREDQRRSLRDVSGAARVSLGYLSEIERGRKEASSELLASICRALDLTLADLLSDASTDLRGAELVDQAASRPAETAPAAAPVDIAPAAEPAAAPALTGSAAPNSVDLADLDQIVGSVDDFDVLLRELGPVVAAA